MIPTWHECSEAGMTRAEASEARGVTLQAAYRAADRLGIGFAETLPRSTPALDEWRRLQVLGLSARQAAAYRGVSMVAAYRAANRLGFKWARQKPGARNLPVIKKKPDCFEGMREAPVTMAQFAAMENAAMRRRCRF